MLELAAEHGGNPEDPNKRDPLDFVLWQPSLPDEPAWESQWGPGTAGLAHRVLGAGAARARRDDRHPRRGSGPGLPAPRVRDGAVRGGDGAAVRAAVVPRRAGGAGRHEDVEVARATSCSSATCARSGTRRRCGSRCWRTTIEADWDWRTGEDMPAAAARLALWRSAVGRGRVGRAGSGAGGAGRGPGHAGGVGGVGRRGHGRAVRGGRGGASGGRALTRPGGLGPRSGTAARGFARSWNPERTAGNTHLMGSSRAGGADGRRAYRAVPGGSGGPLRRCSNVTPGRCTGIW